MRAYLDTPPLVSIEQFPYEQGRAATEMLMKILSGAPMDSRQMVLDGKLIALQQA